MRRVGQNRPSYQCYGQYGTQNDNGGRYQIFDFASLVQHNVGACEAHHLVYLSRGGEDSLDNLMLLCLNHDTVVHRTNAPFDFQDLTFVFNFGSLRDPYRFASP